MPAPRKTVAKKPAAKKVYTRRAYPKTVRGRGAYYTGPSNMHTATGYGDYSMGKNSSFGSQVGAWLGDKAQSLIKSVTGFGDYVKPGWSVKSNSLLSMGQDPPNVRNSDSGGFIVRHREYLQDIITGTPGEFVVTSYKLQPGLQNSFPWLSVISQCFEQYKLRGVIYEFKSTSADSLNSTNTALGEVIMATEYDSKKPNFASKVDMQNHQFAVASRQSMSMLHPIECAHPLSTLDVLYVRNGSVPNGADSRMYDFGNFQIATVGQQGANINIGELWVTYEVEFLKARLPGEGNLVLSSTYWQNGGAFSTSDYFGLNTAPETLLAHPDNNLALTLGATYLEFPESIGNGTFQITFVWYGGSTAITTHPTVSFAAGSGIILGSSIGPLDTSSPYWFAPTPGASSADVVISVIAYVGTNNPGTPRRLTLSGGVLPLTTGDHGMDIFVTSCLTGLDLDSWGTDDIYVPPQPDVLLSKKFNKISQQQQLSNDIALKAEIERLTQLYRSRTEQLTPIVEEYVSINQQPTQVSLQQSPPTSPNLDFLDSRNIPARKKGWLG